MSTRAYPIYKQGNPQLRVFMTDFWMKLVRPQTTPTPPNNVVTFHCSMEMTNHDVKNYLTNIYKIPVVDVRTEVRIGEFVRDPVKAYIKKKDDFKLALVTMPAEIQFEFPKLFDKTTNEEDEAKARKEIKMQQKAFKKFLDRNKFSRGTPAWYSF